MASKANIANRSFGISEHRVLARTLCDRLAHSLEHLAGRTIVYFDRPVYMNIGDLLIYEGAKTLLQRIGVRTLATYGIGDLGRMNGNRRQFRLKPHFDAIDANVERADLIVFQGGGNFGDLWPDHHFAREAILDRYRRKPTLILPQTVHFEKPENFDRMRRIVEAHSSLHFMARDEESLECMKDICDCQLAPDTAHMLWADQETPKNTGADLLVIHQQRRDAESRQAPFGSCNFDWDDIITGTDVIVRRINLVSSRIPTFHRVASGWWDIQAARITARAACLFADASHVTTDRLHGLILATIVETPCKFVDNSYGKLGRYYNSWLRGTPLVTLS